ncbi:L-fucose:H+ symporter permease [Algoriphagus zhangzhouensis]|uniref:MFS transporter, FHS family, L-fucose permease n=1 Tax=Algoriphagus zhangzhouensis TaxID=1073327 RepID=A0A1M7ZD35_9BACT|nr:L-fucose:H+ symporter permease [Algoriphagus zhangzhouensis]TDY45676.1 FHS family L-fucose permease-like MFS transporter [Algoriphagus zhangzhouensis]SHO62732.1 MFS transporter, FHS family, L-fucose permease [Algoriphagus zhangzhouensis]
MNNKPTLIPKNLLLPFILITSLFALWGFANDITNPMVAAFKRVLELNNVQASWVQLAFYGGYFTMALPAAFFIKKYSYKTGILLGLGLYAFGAILFYPAAAFESYGFFLASLYILTFGLAFLETTANPYILSMGPEATATQRLNLSQAFNPMGALAGLFVAKQFILNQLQSNAVDDEGNLIYSTLDEASKAIIRTNDLMVIRNPYVMLGLVVLGMFVVIALVKMPESKDSSNKVDFGPTMKRLFKNRNFVEGTLAQMFYVGAQIMVWTYIYQYAEALGIDNASAVNYGYAALVVFLVGRWVCTFLLRYVSSSKLLAIFAVLAMGFTIGAIFIPGITGLYSLVGISFAMSLMFPTIYGIALEGLGEDSKFAAAFLVMAIVGGAIMPTLQGMILDWGGTGYTDITIMGVSEVNFSFVLPLACFLMVFLFAVRVKNLSTNQ